MAKPVCSYPGADGLPIPEERLVNRLRYTFMKVRRMARPPKRDANGALPPSLARFMEAANEIMAALVDPAPSLNLITQGKGLSRDYILAVTLPKTQGVDYALPRYWPHITSTFGGIAVETRRRQALLQMPLGWRQHPSIDRGRTWHPLMLFDHQNGIDTGAPFARIGPYWHQWSKGPASTLMLPLNLPQSMISSLAGTPLHRLVEMDLAGLAPDQVQSWNSLTITKAEDRPVSDDPDHARLLLELAPVRELLTGQGPPADAPPQVIASWRLLQDGLGWR